MSMDLSGSSCPLVGEAGSVTEGAAVRQPESERPKPPRHFRMLQPVEVPTSRLRAGPTPLLEEKGNALLLTLVAKIAEPFRAHRAAVFVVAGTIDDPSATEFAPDFWREDE
jgi:hypothetical protein